LSQHCRSKTVRSIPFFFGMHSIGTTWCATAGTHHSAVVYLSIFADRTSRKCSGHLGSPYLMRFVGSTKLILLGAYKIQHQNQAKYVQSFVFYSKSFSDWSPMILLSLRKISKFSFKYLYLYSLLLFQPAFLAFASVAPSSRLSQLLGPK
jgi:hypothetical protein